MFQVSEGFFSETGLAVQENLENIFRPENRVGISRKVGFVKTGSYSFYQLSVVVKIGNRRLFFLIKI